MSRSSYPNSRNGSPGPSSSQSSLSRGDGGRGRNARPNYMTVGTGSRSEAAQRLADMLDSDSGYGGSSMMDDGSMRSGYYPGLGEDRLTPSHTPLPGEEIPDNDRRILASHIHQLRYNQSRTTLGRAISRTMETLKKLQEKNAEWPAHYPQVQRETPSAPRDPRPGLQHTQSTLDNHYEPEASSISRPNPLRRAGTTIGDSPLQGESSSAAAQKPAQEPRLVTPQLAQDFSILKLDLRVGGLSQTELVHSLEKRSIASLLDGQISKSIRHLQSLRERIEDTSSKVLVTGDLNAGKSTFCNALLRRKVLPEDQQPCTAIFCEVLDVRENGGVEEVHAIAEGVKYNRDDERTYDVYGIPELEKIVVDNERYAQCKVYIKDIRSVDESLLNNGVVDIALIDAPGLNNDSLKTTAVFARQEEIDVVVFVVSAANHFTLSAKEFIFNAAREKAYIFMVVNGFDNIRDKERCEQMILKQVAHLSPATFKESSELVHFVSSNAIPVAPVGGPGGSGSSGGATGGSGSGDPDNAPDDDEDDPARKHGEPGSPLKKSKGKDKEKIRDFEELEASLRRFVLEKRARSKLAPAKTYLTNVLGDLNNLATVNKDVADQELQRVSNDLKELEPVYEESKKARTEASDNADHTIEDTATEVYEFTRDTLDTAISRVAERDLGVQYPGLFSVYDYADELKAAMLHDISHQVGICEEHARDQTVKGVNMIKALGLRHLGSSYEDFTFRSEKMFTRKKDALARQVDIEVEVWDFFDVNNLFERQEKLAGGGMALTVATVAGGRLFGGVGWIDGALGVAKVTGYNNMRKLILPGLVLTVVLGVGYALTSIPKSLPRRLSAKLSQQLAALDYTHANALRISSEVRRALKFPASELRVGLQRNFEKLNNRKEETLKIKTESEVAKKYFINLIRDSNDIRRTVESVDLEGPAPGVAAGYDF